MTGIEPFLFGAAATGSAAATSGLIGTAGAFSMGTTLSTLSTGLTLASGVSTLFGGMQQASAIKAESEQQAYALEMSARENELDAKQEELRGKQESNDMMDQLIQTIASQRLASAANGVDVNFGTPLSVEKSTRKIASLQMGVTRDDALTRSLARRRQAMANREERLNVRSSGKQKASASILGGITGAGSSISTLIDRRTARG